MTFEEYEKICQREAREVEETLDVQRDESFTYQVLGLAGETGEVAEKVKKILRDKDGQLTDEDREELTKELGDVLWYLTRTATKIGSSLEKVAKQNIEKIASRRKRGKISGSGDNR